MFKQVHRDDTVTEFFISERFVQSQEWETILSEQLCPKEIRKYRYTRDYVKYNGEEYYPNITKRLKFSEIIHATHQDKLLSILHDGGLKPGRKIIPDCTLYIFVDELKDYYIMQCRMENQLFSPVTDISAAVDCRSIVNSPCFEPMSRYGDFKLTFEIQNVIEAYSQQFCLSRKPDFRMLGTFIYKMEIMHTVLVCPPFTEDAETYPLLDQSQTPVICEDPEKEGTFIWCPDSTGDKDKAAKDHNKRGPFRRWEHVTFAFCVPDGIIFKLDHLSSHVSVCIYVNPREGYQESLINDTMQMFLDEVSEVPTIETKRWLVNLLIRAIRGYVDEEKVFEKMNILYQYQPVDLDTVVSQVEELIDGKEFDWLPFIEWMNDVQQTKNTAVILSILNYLNKKSQLCIEKLRESVVPQ
ncbi:hypothetical protein ACJMK2_030658 [Sinanodonta woodiana]|uniref:Uncharacterized protein n=1 Tax=Sinanodonta woodiana TaxID=1069815 RepID=A0ABD3X0C6_SINWO